MPDQRANRTVHMGDEMYRDWEAFVAKSRFPNEVKDRLIREFDAGRQDQIRTWADRAESLAPLSKPVADEVMSARINRAA